MIGAVLLAPSGESKTEEYRVPSASMAPTFDVGEVLSVDLDAYSDQEPQIGDVVVFYPPSGAEDQTGMGCGRPVVSGGLCSVATPERGDGKFIKRIVAGPGDEVELRSGRVVLNGRQQPDESASSCDDASLCNSSTPVTVPEGSYYMLGDNRGESADSRLWGPVRAEWIIGRVG